MYNVNVDTGKKLVRLEMIGLIKAEEAESLIRDVENAAKQFKSKEAVLLANMVEYKPSTPEVLETLQRLFVIIQQSFKKAASIHSSAVAEMQGKRVGRIMNASDEVMRFKSEEEGLKYLFD